MKENIVQYKNELKEELRNILTYWMQYTVDKENGGFYGQIDNADIQKPNAPKGLVLNARILWAFSAAYNYTTDIEYLSIAQRAFDYIKQHFIDKKFGGAYWMLDAKGNALNNRKQIYGLAFCVYGLSEFCRATKNETALNTTIDLFKIIEAKAFDKNKLGYFEAFTVDWKDLPDLRLSDKDTNEKKTMNTHLHVIEAYANLYKVWKNELLKERIGQLVEVFEKYFIGENGHLILFFDEKWNAKSTLVSYGHDIEAAWLLQECAEIIEDEFCKKNMKTLSLKLADAASEGLCKDGSLIYEYEPSTTHFIKEKHSWVQAEAMVGFFKAYQLSGDEKYLRHSLHVWNFIKKNIIDHKNGEWFWGVYENNKPMKSEDKVGPWKCPYHNSRACLEIIKRTEIF